MVSPARQPTSTRTHARRASLSVAVVVLLLGALAVLPAVADSDSSYSQATIAIVAGQPSGAVAVSAALDDNQRTAVAESLPAGITLASGTATVYSYVDNRTLISHAEVTAAGVDLLDGVVTATSVHLSAGANVVDGNAQASAAGSAVSGLHVAGVSDADLPAQGEVDVPGVGTLDILTASSPDQSGDSAGAQVVGLKLVVTTTTDGVPAGTTIIVGTLDVRADQATLDALLGTPTPTPTPSATPTHTPTPTPTPTHTRTPTPGPTLTPTPTGTPATTYPSTSYSAMPTPATPSPAILARFPGAVFPVVGTYTYTDTFGAYRADMPNHQHEGDDIFASYGSPVVAVQDGTITGVSTTPIGGNNIHLTTSRGDYFYYAHLSRFATGLVQGQQVVAGQTIGYVGDTGDAKGTPPHLHFEIHPGGGPAVDPTPYLDAWRAAGHLVATSPSAQVVASATPTPATDDPAMDAALQQAADSFAALQANVASGARRAPGSSAPLGLAGAALLVVNTAGALLIKRLHVGAILLP
jgi:Peptidase family M23